MKPSPFVAGFMGAAGAFVFVFALALVGGIVWPDRRATEDA